MSIFVHFYVVVNYSLHSYKDYKMDNRHSSKQLLCIIKFLLQSFCHFSVFPCFTIYFFLCITHTVILCNWFHIIIFFSVTRSLQTVYRPPSRHFQGFFSAFKDADCVGRSRVLVKCLMCHVEKEWPTECRHKAKWPSRWTSTAPTPRRPSPTTTLTRAAFNRHTCICE